MMRNIVHIDEEKCDGCGLCVTACAEGAIAIIDGKAKLVSEIYCDGLGACLGTCPQDAITVEQREAEDFDEAATEAYLAKKAEEEKDQASACQTAGGGCPGSMARTFEKKGTPGGEGIGRESQLSQWPVQMHLVGPAAPYFKGAELLWAADCVPFAMADFHERFLAGKAVAVGCPKLDDGQLYIDKLAEIIKCGKPKSLTVVHMEVPCCFGMTQIAKEAISKSGEDLNFEDVTVDLQGNVIRMEIVSK
ncbi:MAG: 4Fe-4S ferredoxin [Planctomycetes bacterium]|nr:4Fe-4S ferredoxin [Planctomycetota bacterium]